VLRAARLVLNGRVRVSLAHQDVTDIVKAREQQARLLEQVLQAQEEERARIGLEVHDSTAQHLVALSLSMGALRDTNVPPQVLEDMRHSLAEAQREIRTLAYLLYPPKLSSEGLVKTLQSFIDGFRRRTALSAELTTAGKLDSLPFDIQRTVFRIVQEALANVHRHANAKKAFVTVALKAQGLRVIITDDGQGSGGGERTVGIGVRGMQARLAQFGGELSVTHRASGTTVDGFLPRDKLGPPGPASA
jgi:signal transduction histidine kinase